MSRDRALLPVLLLLGTGLAGCVAPQGIAPAGLPGLPMLPPACVGSCKVPLDDTDRTAWEPTVAVDPLDPDHAVAAVVVGESHPGRCPGGWPYLYATRDGGATWEMTRVPGGPGSPPDHPLALYNNFLDPVLAFLPDGALLFAGLGTVRCAGELPAPGWVGAGGPLAVAVLRSPDGGKTFPPEDVRVLESGRGAWAGAFASTPLPVGAGRAALYRSHDKEWMDVGPEGDVLLAWTDLYGPLQPANPAPAYRGDLVAAHSPDGGRTWTEPFLVARGDEHYGGAFPAILADGTWAVAYSDWTEPLDLFVATSQDQGTAWNPVRIDRTYMLPTLKVQPRGGGERLLLGYPQLLELDPFREVPVLRWSDDGGATWSEPLRLDESEAPGPTLPAFDVAPGGQAYASFFHPLPGEEPRAEVRAVALGDGRASPPSVLDRDFDGEAWFGGDYHGLAAFDGGAYVAWVTRHGEERDLVGARLAAP